MKFFTTFRLLFQALWTKRFWIWFCLTAHLDDH